MVKKWVSWYGENQEEVFLSRSVTQTQSVSEDVAQKIDKEIRKLVDEGYNQAKKYYLKKLMIYIK